MPGAVDVDRLRRRAVDRQVVDGREVVHLVGSVRQPVVVVHGEVAVRDVALGERDPLGRVGVDRRVDLVDPLFGLAPVLRLDQTGDGPLVVALQQPLNQRRAQEAREPGQEDVRHESSGRAVDKEVVPCVRVPV